MYSLKDPNNKMGLFLFVAVRFGASDRFFVGRARVNRAGVRAGAVAATATRSFVLFFFDPVRSRPGPKPDRPGVLLTGTWSKQTGVRHLNLCTDLGCIGDRPVQLPARPSAPNDVGSGASPEPTTQSINFEQCIQLSTDKAIR